MYELYKPLRNYMRQFGVVPALAHVWQYSVHLAYGGKKPSLAVDEIGRALDIRQYVFPWDLEILAQEIVLNGGTEGVRSLGDWPDFARAVNAIRDLENNIVVEQEDADLVLRGLHRIVHRQFPWQRKQTVASFARTWKIWSSKSLADIVEREIGLTVRQHTELCLAINGHFTKTIGMVTTSDYASLLGISSEARDQFFDRLSYSLEELREHTVAEQHYDADWLYSFNPLRDRPLIRFDSTNPSRVMCPLPPLLQNRISDGLYYDVCRTKDFNSAFGPAFQSYVGEVLRATLPGAHVTGEAQYHVGKNRKDGVDWIAGDTTATLFIECKTKRMRQSAKFLTSTDELDEELRMMAKFVVQTYKNVSDAIAGLTSWQSDGRPLYPVIVTLENWHIFTPPIADALDRHIREGVVAAGLEETVVDSIPYTIMAVEDLEIAGQIMARTGIERFMRAKTDREHRRWTIGGFMPSTFGDELKDVRTILFEYEWRAFGDDLRKRHEAIRRP